MFPITFRRTTPYSWFVVSQCMIETFDINRTIYTNSQSLPIDFPVFAYQVHQGQQFSFAPAISPLIIEVEV